MDTNNGNVQRTIAYSMSKRKSTGSIGQKSISWEKAKPTGLKGANDRALDP